jgi:signal transduction histidine kinase
LATAQLATDALQNVDHPHVQKVSRRLMTAVSKAIALCENTLRHGKADDPVPEKKMVGLAELVSDVGASLGLLESEGFTFDIQIPEDVEVFADPEQLHRVLLNLCRNAVEAQGDTGIIEVSCTVDADATCHITVADKGPGIPEALRPSLFKAFSSARAGGTGLGLATARDIVLAHGGQIGLVNTGEDGTSFMVCLPGKEADECA